MKSILLSTLTVLFVLAIAANAQESAPALSAEIQVCTAITERMPQGTDSTFTASTAQLYCWSKITGGTGDGTVTHVWLRDGTEVRRVELAVKSTSWRTWSVKNLYGKTGSWEVRVLDASGATLASTKFTVTQ
jgi:hypothetical protein